MHDQDPGPVVLSGRSVTHERSENRLARTVGTTGADRLIDSLLKSGPRRSNNKLAMPSAPAETISVTDGANLRLADAVLAVSSGSNW